MAAASSAILYVLDVFKQQYTSCMKIDSGGNLGLSREYSEKQFGPMFHLWCNCLKPLPTGGRCIICMFINSLTQVSAT